jgi:hypothetical protein
VPAGAVATIVAAVVNADVLSTGTTAVICADELMTKEAATPLKVTDVTPASVVPVNTTLAFATAADGFALVRAGVTENVPVEVAVPMRVVMAMVPVKAPAGTMALTCVAEIGMMVRAAMPPKVIAVVPLKLVPVITTVAPSAPEPGLKLAIVGAAPRNFACTRTRFLNGSE